MDTMTSKERILAAIHHKKVDRLPTDIWATNEVWDQLKRHFDVEDVVHIYDRLGIDGIMEIGPDYVGPKRWKDSGDTTFNEWGMGYRAQAYGSGKYDEQIWYPLAEFSNVVELKKYPWPSPDDYDYAGLAAKALKHPDRAVLCGYTAIFYWHNNLRGLEQSLVDALLYPEITHYLVERMSEFFTEYHQRCFEATRGLIQLTQVTDDFGSQNGLLVSPKTFDLFYKPAIQRAIDLAHSYDLLVFHHDDGDMRKLLPRLTEMGIDLLNPIQWRCGNWDLAELKAEYGATICFHSGVDNQHTLPFGTPEDVRGEVRMLKSLLASDGTGYILGPCHNLQPVTPIENIIAMYEAAREN
jgi:uroporphyrinogen decarboxylase